ncbi:MAG: radical SAM protein [Thermodesulfovibrionales bacterium]|nr:radical SAM protein [Thermodesulfovibrionales bacterium]
MTGALKSSKDYPLPVITGSRGNIYEIEDYRAAGMSGGYFLPLEPSDLIPVPEGTKFFYIPDSVPVAYRDKRLVSIEGVMAVAAFLPPGYTRTMLPAYEQRKSTVLPLWSYTAIAWYRGRFHAAAVKVAWHRKADPMLHDDRKLLPLIQKRLSEYKDNRLLRHLKRCALEYHCFAAKNVFFQRWEAPVPTSPGCNARCIGCLSHQEGECCASQERIKFVPSPEEIRDICVPHLKYGEDAIVSFGQGCEGEPLLQADIIEEAIRLIRKETEEGIINLNTNGYSPEKIKRLADAGLQSIRISLNSTIEDRYNAYYRPKGYTFKDVIESLRVSKKAGLFTSINLLVFPGYTDRDEEVNGLIRLIGETGIDLIQMRNLSIDPYLYMKHIKRPSGHAMGIKNLIESLRMQFPQLRIGYFNLSKREMEQNNIHKTLTSGGCHET